VLLHAEGPDPKNADFGHFVDNVAMQTAAMNPMVVRRDEIAQTQVDKQKEIYEAQLKEEGKPQQAWPKIIEGKVAKWFTEVTLLGQDSVWDPPAGSIDKIRQELAKKIGGDVTIHAFVRYALGEGIERAPQEDLAAEVAKTIGN
jgi:elongation factor Ts